MTRASYWQYERYLWKEGLIQDMNQRLEIAPVPLSDILSEIKKNPDLYVHRRVLVEGAYDFSHEVVLRNRRLETMPGVFSIVPLTLAGQAEHILVNRGFIPLALSKPEDRKPFQISRQASPTQDKTSARFIGLLKASSPRRWLGPRDPEVSPANRLDAWLWFDIAHIQKQLNYSVLPLSVEIMDSDDLSLTRKKILQSKSGRDEIFDPSAGQVQIARGDSIPDRPYPIAVFDPVMPPGRHFGYIFEWAFLALLTLAIGAIAQMKRN